MSSFNRFPGNSTELFKLKMILFLQIIFLIKFCSSELLVHSIDDVNPENLKAEATLLETVKENPICKELTEISDIYEVIVEEDGVKTKENFTIRSILTDETVYEKTIPNANYTVSYRKYLTCYDQEEPFLANQLMKYYIDEPSKQDLNISEEVVGNIMSGDGIGEYYQDEILDKLLFQGRERDGFFVEAGAWDFVHTSNSLWYELRYNWTGLLIEPHYLAYQSGRHTHRNVWSVSTCLSTLEKPSLVSWEQGDNLMGVFHKDVNQVSVEEAHQQCFPLYSYLAALDHPTVNLFILDIEGAEFPVLKTIPWDKVDIEVILVELINVEKLFEGSREDIHQYLKDQSYEYLGTISKYF